MTPIPPSPPPTTHRRPRMVVFDLGGVLIRICRSWAQACAAAGLDLRPGADDPVQSAQRHDLAHRHGLGLLSSDEFFRQVSLAMRGLYSPDEVRLIHDAWLLGEYPGVHELIADIHSAGLDTGVLSNTNHAHWLRLAPKDRAQGGMGEFTAPGLVRHLHASHLLGLAKPDPAIYRRFHAMFPHHSPADLLFFDDLPENIEAAIACGWQAHQIDHTGDTAAQMRERLEEIGV